MTQHRDLFAALAAPFDSDEVKLRSQAGRQLHYVTARTVMNRLDEVLGPENWWDDFVPLEHSVICRLTIRMPDGSTLTKSDAGGYAGMADPGDDDKSGFADAFKRAAVKFGVGRYLYRDGIPRFAREVLRGRAEVEPVATTAEAPSEPAHQNATNTNANAPATPASAAPSVNPSSRGGHGEDSPNAPRTGRALFAWTKDQDEKYEYGLLKHLNAWAKRQDFPGRMVDWEGEQVSRAYAEACRKVRAIQNMQQATEAALSN
ncbi:MAG: Rad52/Rad22 family DNA repair protein [Isosphaeraceae bacterium]